MKITYIGGANMPTLEKVTYDYTFKDFCLTDCGPSEGCGPDDVYESEVVVVPKR